MIYDIPCSWSTLAAESPDEPAPIITISGLFGRVIPKVFIYFRPLYCGRSYRADVVYATCQISVFFLRFGTNSDISLFKPSNFSRLITN